MDTLSRSTCRFNEWDSCMTRDVNNSDPCPELGPEWFKCRLCGHHFFNDEYKTHHGGVGRVVMNKTTFRDEHTEL
jgi:hypothetical protein